MCLAVSVTVICMCGVSSSCLSRVRGDRRGRSVWYIPAEVNLQELHLRTKSLGVSSEFRLLEHVIKSEHKLRKVNVPSAAAAILLIQSLNSYCMCLVVSV